MANYRLTVIYWVSVIVDWVNKKLNIDLDQVQWILGEKKQERETVD